MEEVVLLRRMRAAASRSTSRERGWRSATRVGVAGLAMVVLGLVICISRRGEERGQSLGTTTMMRSSSSRRSSSKTDGVPSGESTELAASSEMSSVQWRVVAPPSDALMRLYATVEVAPEEAGEVTIEYRAKRNWNLEPLWTAPVAVETPKERLRIPLYRLRPKQRYVFRVHFSSRKKSEQARVLCEGEFVAPATGWTRFDSGPYVAIEGDRPGFEMGTFAAYPALVAKNEKLQWFEGLLAVDAEGWVVWMYSLCMLEAWDFLPDGGIVVVARTDGSCEMLTNHGEGTPSLEFLGRDGDVYAANSQLQKIAPDGSLVSQHIQSCSGGPLNFNKLSHECRVDRASDGLKVLTTAYNARVVPDVYAPIKMGPSQVVYDHVDVFADAVVVAWDHVRNELETVVDLSTLVPPSQDVMFETTAWNEVHMTCAGDAGRNAIEFHHISSVSLGSTDNYVIASRNLDAVWSVAKGTGAVQWTLSSHDDVIPSDFAFARDLDKFYQPHSVIQLESGDLLVIDDGTDRPGCTVVRVGGCFSRAVLYRLDHQHSTVTLLWQFSAPFDVRTDFLQSADRDVWNEVGGSAFRLANGHFLVAFSSVDASANNPRASALVFELDIDGNRTASSVLAIPTPVSNVGTQNGYRFVPWQSINGEASGLENPLVLLRDDRRSGERRRE